MIAAATTTEYRDDSREELLQFAALHFAADPEYRGRVRLEYMMARGGAPVRLLYCFTEQLPEKLEQLEIRTDRNYYVTANEISGGDRGKEHVFRLRNIVIDVDDHRETITEARRRELVESFALFLEYKGLPLPCNTVVRSGRGLQLWWAIEPISYKLEREYSRIRAILIEDVLQLLEEWRAFYRLDPDALGLDMNASHNTAGIFRLPDTYNTKTEPLIRATAHRIHERRLDVLQELKIRAGRMLNDQQDQSNVLYYPTECAELGTARAAVIFNLQAGRKAAGQQAGAEQRNNFLFCLYNSLASAGASHEAAMKRVEQLNGRFIEPMTEAEIRRTLCSSIKKRYQLKNEKIIDLLGMTAAEQNAYRFFKGGSRLNNTREQQRQAARDEKARRDEIILEHYEKGETLQEIAAAAGCTAPTVGNVLKRAGLPSRPEQLRGRVRVLCQQGLDPEKIAEETGASLRTVYRHIQQAREEGEILATELREVAGGQFIDRGAETLAEATGATQAGPNNEEAPEQIRKGLEDPSREIPKESAGAADQDPAAVVLPKIKSVPRIGFGTIREQGYRQSIDTDPPGRTLEDLRAKIEKRRRRSPDPEDQDHRRRLIEHIEANRARRARLGISTPFDNISLRE